MNPRLQEQFQQVHRAIDALEEQLVLERTASERLRERQEDLTQQLWSQSRRAATLQEAHDTVGELQVRCRRYEALLKETRVRLRALLSMTKALGEEAQA